MKAGHIISDGLSEVAISKGTFLSKNKDHLAKL
jgi:hypothetical protein